MAEANLLADFSTQFSTLVTQLPASIDTLWLAYSGGLDSHVLLDLLQQNVSYSLRVVHINHGLSQHAQQWQQHCQSICRNYGIDCHIETVQIQQQGKGTEAAARLARYHVFADVIKQTGCLLTAHHLDDQAETVLLRLLRGSGLHGLAGISAYSRFADGFMIRPLLNYTREQLQAYAHMRKLKWIDDESNEDTRFARNYIRHKIMPRLQQVWPGANKTLSSAAELCQEGALLLSSYASELYRNVATDSCDQIRLLPLTQLEQAQQRLVLRYWLQQQHIAMPSYVKLQEIQRCLLTARPDANPIVAWGAYQCRRFRGKLYIVKQAEAIPTDYEQYWDLQKTLQLPAGLGSLSVQATMGDGLRLPANAGVTLKFWREGERFHPAKRQRSCSLKKLWQEWAVEPWRRDRIPLIYINEQLAAVVGYAIADTYQAKADEKGHVFSIDSSR